MEKREGAGDGRDHQSILSQVAITRICSIFRAIRKALVPGGSGHGDGGDKEVWMRAGKCLSFSRDEGAARAQAPGRSVQRPACWGRASPRLITNCHLNQP